MNNPFDYIPDGECVKAFNELTCRIESLRDCDSPENLTLLRQLEEGKMLGVLIASDISGGRHTLYAFSGQLGEGGFRHRMFVEPVMDYLEPDGYFKNEEKKITRQNRCISLFEAETLARIRNEYEEMKASLDAEVAAYKEKCRRSKLRRAARKEAASGNERELAALTRESQFEKAELRRMKKRAAATLEPYAANLREAEGRLAAMKETRRSDSEALQQWLFTNFRVMNARGESRSLSEIFAETPLKVPPSGAGECCAPKLLQAAYRRGWRPESIAEFWYGNPKCGEVRLHGHHYPACRGKCLPVLSWMLQGLPLQPPLSAEYAAATTFSPVVIYENEWFCIIDKPSGMLSVPGKGSTVSAQEWLETRYGTDRHVKVAHRLDQDTSGLLIATFGEKSYKEMQSLFAMRLVKKTYVAELEGDFEAKGAPAKGCVRLPLSPDWLDRPRQRIDLDSGKEAITYFEFISTSEGRSRIEFHPATGRTHQLRVHAASELGLGMPIAGDRLYGKGGNGSRDPRLLLHAKEIEFTFPADGCHYHFECPVPF